MLKPNDYTQPKKGGRYLKDGVPQQPPQKPGGEFLENGGPSKPITHHPGYLHNGVPTSPPTTRGG